MTALPSTIPAGHEPSPDEFQAMIDLLAAMSGQPAPVSTSSNGTATSGTTETRDAVLGDYTFTVPAVGATWRYKVCYLGAIANSSVVDDNYAFNIRDGGASTPTASSTLVASSRALMHTTSGAGQVTHEVMGTWVPGAGTHTLSAFMFRVAGSGVGTPVSQAQNRELFVQFVGTN